MTTTASDNSAWAEADLDVLVVGGGLVGAGTALDAVTRGLRVGLVSAGDWAEGRPGTLVHTGLVDRPQIGVVAALRRECELLLDGIAPHLVHRVPLLVPLTRGLPERVAVSTALGVLPGQRQLTRRAVLRLAPAVDLTDVSGAVQLFGAQVDDARLTITVLRTAIAYGVLARSHTRVSRLLVEHGRVLGVALDGGDVVRARCVVLADLPSAGEAVHLVLPRGRLRASTGLVLRSRGRTVSVLPWGRHWIVGGTGSGTDPARLLEELNRHLSRPIRTDEVVCSSTGPAGVGAGGRPSVRIAQPGLVAVQGGGVIGYRADAELAVDAATTQIGGLHPPSATRRVPLVGGVGFTARWNQRHLLASRAGIPVLGVERLLHRYGSAVAVLVDEIERRPELARPLPGAEDYLAVEVWFAVVHEEASQLADVLARRTRIAMETSDGGAAAAPYVARLMAAELGWDADAIQRQLRRAVSDADLLGGTADVRHHSPSHS